VVLGVSLFLLGPAALNPALGDSIAIGNSGFETPNVGGGYEYGYSDTIVPGHSENLYGVSGESLQYDNGAGIAANGSAFGVEGAFGDQAAFLQYGSGSDIYQPITVPGEGLVTVSFYDEGRGNYGYGSLAFNVLLLQGTFTSGGSYAGDQFLAPTNLGTFDAESAQFPVLSGGTYTLVFQGTDSPKNPQTGQYEDQTTFIDCVTASELVAPTTSAVFVPLPSAYLQGLILFAGIGAARRIRRAGFGLRWLAHFS
jgi:hypothetical protein